MANLKEPTISLDALVDEDRARTLCTVAQPAGHRFVVPMNQRPWSWKDTELDDLWRDLVETTESFYECDGPAPTFALRPGSPLPHFFGVFTFLTGDGDQEREVFDGQQRLTAIALLTAVLREPVVDRAQAATGPLRGRLDQLAMALSAWLVVDPAAANPEARLLVEGPSQRFFESCIVVPRSREDRDAAFEALPQAERGLRNVRRLWSSVAGLRKLVEGALSNVDNERLCNYVGALNMSLQHAFAIVDITLRDATFALSVFEVLNARGRELTQADKVKNECFLRSVAADRPQVGRQWRRLASIAPDQDVETYLRIRRLMLDPEGCKRSRIYEDVRDKELRGSPPGDCLDAWLADAELLSSVLDGTHTEVARLDALGRDLKSLRDVLGATLAYPLVLAGARVFLPSDPTKFARVARLAVNFTFRVLTVGTGLAKGDVAQLERGVAAAARKLLAEGTVASAAGELRKESEDNAFKPGFSVFAPRNAKIQDYVIREYELDRGQGVVGPLQRGEKLNLEHIMPKTLSKSTRRLGEWSFARDVADPTKPSADHAAYKNRIGNLLLLDGEINRHVSNYDFDAKRRGRYPAGAQNYSGSPRKSYRDSQLALPSEIRNKRSWNFDAIDKRQTKLANEALSIWSLSAS